MKEGEMTCERWARVGDLVVLGGHWPGDPRRVGTVIEALGARDQKERYRVKWDDGKTETWYPTIDAIVEHDDHRVASDLRERNARRAAA
jgi:hypothetical protein